MDSPDSDAHVARDSGGHPLFPCEGPVAVRSGREFDRIFVQRFLDDGTKERCPKVWNGSELRSWQQILELYGGECRYQLLAMTAGGLYHAATEKIYFARPCRKPF